MAISDRIESIEQHLTDDWNSVESLGADTSFDKNIENIAAALDGVYEELPKVAGEGTSISLSPTKKGGIKLDLKGNTSQETTTGINKIKLVDKSSTTTGGVTYNINNQVLTLSGTSTGINILVYFDDITLPAGTYYFYLLRTKTTRVDISLRTTNNAMIQEANFGNVFQNTLSNKAFTLSTDTLIHSMNLWLPSGIDTTDTYKVMICSASHTATDYEPYTGGQASPNPQYPQDIHVVSGDNSIDVCGKNLFDYNKITTSAYYTNNYDGSFTRNSNGSSITINVNDASVPYNTFSLLAGTYSVSFDVTTTEAVTINNWFLCTVQNGTRSNLAKSIGVQIPANTTTHIKAENYVVVNNAEKVGFAGYLSASTGVVISNIQVEKNTQATTYEEYKGASYPISLGVENLVNPSLFTINGSDKVASIINGEVTSSSLSGYAGARIELGQNINLKTNDVIYVRLKIKSDVAGDIFNTIQLFNSSNAVITYTPTKLLTPTLTTEYQEYIMKYVLGIDDVLRRLYIQHKGSSSNVFTIKDIQVSYVNGSYTPYGTTPIELCKIGDYQDSIKKSTGKNLFDKDNLQNGYVNSSGVFVSDIAWKTTNFISVQPNTTYIVSNATGRTLMCQYTSTSESSFVGTRLDTSAKTITFTTLSNAKYIRISPYNGTGENVNTLQLEKGSTATLYEPYGKVWYVNKQISKVILDGTESWEWNSGQSGAFTHWFLNHGKAISYSPTLCDYFINSQSTTWVDNRYGFDSVGGTMWIKSTSTFNSLSNFTTWLETNKPITYYQLATPTYTEITDSTLLSQLEIVKRSYDGQTNISQENNDLPFELTASALLDVNTQINHLEAQIEALS